MKSYMALKETSRWLVQKAIDRGDLEAIQDYNAPQKSKRTGYVVRVVMNEKAINWSSPDKKSEYIYPNIPNFSDPKRFDIPAWQYRDDAMSLGVMDSSSVLIGRPKKETI